MFKFAIFDKIVLIIVKIKKKTQQEHIDAVMFPVLTLPKNGLLTHSKRVTDNIFLKYR